MSLPPVVEGRPLAEGEAVLEGLVPGVVPEVSVTQVALSEGCGASCWCSSCVAAMGGRAEAERVRVVCCGLEESGSVGRAGERSGVGVRTIWRWLAAGGVRGERVREARRVGRVRALGGTP